MSMNENLYSSKTLMSNWYEDRSNPKNKNHTFFTERKAAEPIYKDVLTKTEFTSTFNNWIVHNPSQNHFKTTYGTEFKKPVEQNRTSEVDKFLLKKDVFEKNPSALEEYRQKYTKGAHIFPRSYPGAREKNL